MHSLHIAAQIAAWLGALGWLFKLLEAIRGLPTIPDLIKPEYDVDPFGQLSLIVIVPARNEAPNIAACLTSLVDQDYANLRILAVDDRSTDETGAIMDALATTHADRLGVIHVSELPAGWLGKTHAMALAARTAIARYSPDYLLFTDGDVLFSPDILRRSLAHVEATQADHFVLMLTALVKSFGEAMILAHLQAMSVFGPRLWRVADPKARDAIGVGGFNLIRTAAYLQLGGFDAMPMEILEDVNLGRRVKLAGLRQRVAAAPGAVAVHWAAGLFGIVNGMTKNLFALFHFRPALLLAAAVSFAGFCLAPCVFVFVPGLRLPAVINLVAIFGLYVLSSRRSRISPAFAVFYPVSATLLAYSMLRSMVLTLVQGGVIWRGTFYSLAELRKNFHTPR
jgi:glycosyltransferase involved in cell wall biosynthesis